MNYYFTTRFGRQVKCDQSRQCFFYPSDLEEVRLLPYKGKLEQNVSFKEKKENLCEAYLKLRLKNIQGYRQIPCTYNQEEHCLYIAENNFNRYWKEIRFRLMGFYMAQKKATGITPDILDKQVDLSLYITKTRDARVVKNKIEVFGRQPDRETQQLLSKRASAMDNKRMIYIYDSAGGPVHDKSCELVMDISNEGFCATETMPQNREVCKKCRRRLYVRLACGDDFKNYEIYNRFMKNGVLPQATLEKFVRDFAGQLYMEAPDVMRVKCGEDTWKIKMDSDGQRVLYHNNYVMINEEERYITEGFHPQNITAVKLERMFKYIEEYTWQGHLEAKRRDLEEPVPLEQTATEDTSLSGRIIRGDFAEAAASAAGEGTAEEKWWKRMMKWISLWKDLK